MEHKGHGAEAMLWYIFGSILVAGCLMCMRDNFVKPEDALIISRPADWRNIVTFAVIAIIDFKYLQVMALARGVSIRIQDDQVYVHQPYGKEYAYDFDQYATVLPFKSIKIFGRPVFRVPLPLNIFVIRLCGSEIWISLSDYSIPCAAACDIQSALRDHRSFSSKSGIN